MEKRGGISRSNGWVIGERNDELNMMEIFGKLHDFSILVR